MILCGVIEEVQIYSLTEGIAKPFVLQCDTCSPRVACNPRRPLCVSEASTCCEAPRDIVGRLQAQLWSSPSFVYRLGQRPQGDLIVEELNPRGRSSQRIE